VHIEGKPGSGTTMRSIPEFDYDGGPDGLVSGRPFGFKNRWWARWTRNTSRPVVANEHVADLLEADKTLGTMSTHERGGLGNRPQANGCPLRWDAVP
jgi:hypothetical protein